MVKVFYTDISSVEIDAEYPSVVSEMRNRYICSINDNSRKKQSVYVWKLLEYVSAAFDINAEVFFVDSVGKWLCSDNSFNFSLSHSGNMVAVAVAVSEKIGVDIEKCSEKILKTDKNLFSDAISEDDKIKILTVKWTEKESKYKAGIETGHFNSVEVTDLEKNRYILTVYANDCEAEFIETDVKRIL